MQPGISPSRILRKPARCPPGNAGVPPAQHWQGLAHFLHPARPATAPGLCFGRAHADPAGRVPGCRIAGKLSVTERECMRAGRPRSRVGLLPSLLLLEEARVGLPGRSPAEEAEPSRLVAPRCTSCHSFFVCFEVMFDASTRSPSTLQTSPFKLHPSNFKLHPPLSRGPAPSCGA